MDIKSLGKRFLVLLLVLASLTFVSAVFAQEATEEVGDTSDAVVAEESEASEVGHEEDTVAGAEEGVVEEAAASPLSALGINTGFLLSQIINFLLLFLILRFALWKPIVNMLDSRSAKIQKGLEDAAAAANARRNAEAEAEKIQTQARTEAARAVEEARGRGEEVGRSVESEARSEAERIRAEARARANEERDRQLADMRGQVAAIAVAVAERLIGESLDANRQQAIVSDFLSKLPAGARNLSGNVEVISAMPLNAQEQARVASELGGNASVTYSVDPELLGGLIVRTQDRVIDGSVRSGLSEVSGRLR
jgi:F-type H+-transporting ATPase subunit b